MTSENLSITPVLTSNDKNRQVAVVPDNEDNNNNNNNNSSSSITTEPSFGTHPLLQLEDNRRARRKKLKDNLNHSATGIESTTSLNASTASTPTYSSSQSGPPPICHLINDTEKNIELSANMEPFQLKCEFSDESSNSVSDVCKFVTYRHNQFKDSAEQQQVPLYYQQQPYGTLSTKYDIVQVINSPALKEQLAISLNELEHSREENNRYREEQKKLKCKYLELENDLVTYKLKLSLLECRYSEQTKELDDVTFTAREQEKKASNFKSREMEVSRLLKEAESDRLALEKLKPMQLSLCESKKIINDLQEDNNEYKKSISILSSEKDSLTRKLSKIDDENRVLQASNDRLTVCIKQLETKGDELESALGQSKADNITTERRLDGIQKSQEAELNALRAEMNEKEQAFSCSQLQFDAIKKEIVQSKQNERSLGVTLELKEYELEQMKQLRRIAEQKLHSQPDTSKITEVSNQLTELMAKHKHHIEEAASEQEEMTRKLAEGKKEKRFIMKQLKRLEQLYTSREKIHTTVEQDYSKLSQLFLLLRENNIFKQIPNYQKMVDGVYSNNVPSVNNTSPVLTDISSIYAEADEVPQSTESKSECMLKRSNSAGSELKGILKNCSSHPIPKSSTPNNSQNFSPNLAYTASKHRKWLGAAEKNISDVL